MSATKSIPVPPAGLPKSMTGLKARLKELEEQNFELLYVFNDDPQIRGFQKEQEDLQLKIEIRKAQVTCDRKNALAATAMAMSQIATAIKKLQKASPDNFVKDIMEGIHRGCKYDSKWRCTWISGSRHYAILAKVAGLETP